MPAFGATELAVQMLGGSDLFAWNQKQMHNLYTEKTKVRQILGTSGEILGIKEHTIQVKVIQHIRTFWPNALIFSIPNGAATSAKNRINLFLEGLTAGVPDLFLAEARHGFNGLFVEMKTQEGLESHDQKRIRLMLNERNYLVYVARSSETAIEIIEDYLS